MGRRKKKKPIKLKIETETLHSIAAVLLMLLGVLIMISFSGQGLILQQVNSFLIQKLGLAMFFLPFVFISSGLIMLQTKRAWSEPNVLLGTLILMLATMIGFKLGEIGRQAFYNFSRLISSAGTYVVAGGLMIVAALIIMQSSLVDLVEEIQKWCEQWKESRLNRKIEKLKNKQKGLFIPKIQLGKNSKKINVNQPDLETNGVDDDKTGTAVASGKNQTAGQTAGKSQDDEGGLDAEGSLIPTNMPLVWEYPPLSLLSDKKGGKADRGDVNENADIIEGTLESFGIQAEVKEVNYGPSVTQYALQVTRGTKLSRITSLSTDLAMSLAAPTGQIRIEAPIAGRSLVGIEVPNRSPEFVTLRTILGSSKLKNHPSKLAIGLGINVAGQPVITDIASMPHLLIAGATGSGKSVCINNILSSLLYRASPSELRLILVDPKRVELTQYDGIPHLLTPVIVEPKKVVSALKWTVNLMEKRYKQLSEVGVKDIRAYNELAAISAMPNIVVVVDEMADVMLFAPGEVEETITRIAQMARAVGIYLILSTQRPSVDVITGLIKANIPARIAFNVLSMTDSRVILDSSGAEKLLGKGDMLFLPPDKSKPLRVQGTFVSPKETKTLIDYLKSHGHQPQYEKEITTKYKAKETSVGLDAAEEKDDLFDDAVRVFNRRGKASASLLQRRLSIGYNRAARILDQMFEAGLIGPHEGSKARDVRETELQAYLAKLDSQEQ